MIVFESAFYDVVFIIFAFFGFLYQYFTKNNNYWKNKGVAHEIPLPFFGNVKNVTLLKSTAPEELQRLYQLFPKEDFIGIYQSRKPVLLLRSPELCKQIFVKDFNSFHGRGSPINEKIEPLRANLLNLEGQRWKALRSKLTPTFTSGKLKQMFPLLSDCGAELQTSLGKMADEKNVLEMREVSAQYTTDVIGSCAFGIKINSIPDENSRFREMGSKIFAPDATLLLKRYIRWYLPQLYTFLGLKFFPKGVEDFFLGVVNSVIKHRELTNEVRDDFMQLLIQLKNRGYIDSTDEKSEDILLDDNLIAAQAFVFFIAGFETSSTIMGFCLYELALNTDIQEKLREEIDKTLDKYSGKLTYEGIQEMEYLEMVVSETMRKYPPFGVLVRQCNADYTIPGTTITIEKGIQVLLPVYALHHDPQYYPDPDRFDPERFSKQEKDSRHPFTYLPFGEGPRICIALRFAKVQMMVGLASVISKFSVKPCTKTSIPLQFDPRRAILASKSGIWLELNHRSKPNFTAI